MQQAPERTKPFADLKLSAKLNRAVEALNYTTPTPIQEQAIPLVLDGRDLMAAAQTGSGKTAAFTLPLLQIIEEDYSGRPKPGRIRALILTPTRELAAQVEESVKGFSKFMPTKSTVVFGGVNIRPQIQRLKQGIAVLVATPGRLLDLHGQGCVDFADLGVLVLDEADRMLDMGFIPDVRRILDRLPADRQNLMFSATFSSEIRKLAQSFLHDPATVDVSPKNTAAETVEQRVIRVDQSRKTDLLGELLREDGESQALVFTRTKHGANRLTRKLEQKGITAAAIHGNKSQAARIRALKDFKEHKIQTLVATDIAARGLDIEQLPRVFNFELPEVPEDYVHRIGRTGRAGASGNALNQVSGAEVGRLRAIEKVLRRQLPDETITGYEPTVREREALPNRRAGGRGGRPKAAGSSPRKYHKKRSGRVSKR